MSDTKKAPAADQSPAILPGFKPPSVLWVGPQAPYESEQAVRWAMRRLQAELARAEAVAVHRRQLMVHPQRFCEVVSRDAITRFQKRHAAEA